ncbi:AlpA family transcriptional regulator [Nocardioides sp. Arc9.136]|uniref:helix-turn-helix transcriptional regulator n=1 Tax=Nocardioides sp. Arc9.136 TaxID=2996826 RepID=UPI0026657597|nr:hypothetical protein [Nocardioides sp. Arc9.136]WKN47473.1 hypothetical protein OSR43_15705 [Nocardioides sp. Arc9.136]
MPRMTTPMHGPGNSPLNPRQLLTLLEVADLLGKHLDTVKAWNTAGRFPNRVQDSTGRKAWRIPVSDLVAAGLLDPSRVEDVANAVKASRESRKVQHLRETIVRLEERLAAERAISQERAGMIAILNNVIARRGGAA